MPKTGGAAEAGIKFEMAALTTSVSKAAPSAPIAIDVSDWDVDEMPDYHDVAESVNAAAAVENDGDGDSEDDAGEAYDEYQEH